MSFATGYAGFFQEVSVFTSQRCFRPPY